MECGKIMTPGPILALRALTLLAGIAIQFTFPLKAEEAPLLAIERGTQLIDAGKYELAENALHSALRHLDGASDLTLFTATANLGAAFYYRGRLTEAESTYQRAVEIRRRLPATNRPDVSAVFNNLALVY